MNLRALFRNIRNAISLPGDSLSTPSGWMTRLLALSSTSSGIAINEYNALTVSDVFKCDRVIRETVAMLPCKVYRKQERGRQELIKHPLYFLLHDEPNDLMTAFTFWELVCNQLNIWGRHFSYIERDQLGRPAALWPIRPDMCRFQVVDGKVWFYARPYDGPEVKYWADEILYIPGLTRDGIHTYSPIALHRESLGLSKATEVFGAKLFGNGAHAGGFLKHKGNLSPEAAKRLKASFEERHAGLENAHRLAVLEEGMEFESNTIPPEDAQFLQTRQFQRAEIAGIFRVPPHKIGDLSRATFSNIEQQDLEFLRDCIAPWLERIEQASNRQLLMPYEKGRVYIEFEIKGMLRGDTAARAAWYQAMFNTGAYSPNRILESENEEPYEGGDEHFVPMNMVLVSQASRILPDDPDVDPTGDPLQRFRQAGARFFRDAIGRTLRRKPQERARYAEAAFLGPVLAMIECVDGSVSKSMEFFAQTHAASIGTRCVCWGDEMLADDMVGQEVELCIKAIQERKLQ